MLAADLLSSVSAFRFLALAGPVIPGPYIESCRRIKHAQNKESMLGTAIYQAIVRNTY